MRKIGSWLTASKLIKSLVFEVTNVNEKNEERRESIQRLMRLIQYTRSDISPYDFTPEQPDISSKEINNVAMKKITTDLRVLNDNEKHVKIVFTFSQMKMNEKTKDFSTGALNTYIIIPHEYHLINEGEPRVFHIANELDYLLTSKRYDGLGYLEVQYLDLVATQDGFLVYDMGFKSYDVAQR